jgi:hypothetical protein
MSTTLAELEAEYRAAKAAFHEDRSEDGLAAVREMKVDLFAARSLVREALPAKDVFTAVDRLNAPLDPDELPGYVERIRDERVTEGFQAETDLQADGTAAPSSISLEAGVNDG